MYYVYYIKLYYVSIFCFLCPLVYTVPILKKFIFKGCLFTFKNPFVHFHLLIII